MARDACIIKNHKLIKKCPSGHQGGHQGPTGPYGPICNYNKCQSVVKKVSGDANAFGDVYVLKNDNIAKVNKIRVRSVNISNEIRIQRIAAKHDLAPKIYEYYRASGTDKYYIIMENLMSKGYDTFHNVFHGRVVPLKAILELRKKIKMLHKLGIAHRDLHQHNIFYNRTLNKILFIDFGLSKLYTHEDPKGPEALAILNEKWSKFRNFSRFFNGPWKTARGYYIKLGTNYGLHRWFIEDYNYMDVVDHCRKNIHGITKRKVKSLDFNSTLDDILNYHNR
jgi:serine/threonine protein kinase